MDQGFNFSPDLPVLVIGGAGVDIVGRRQSPGSAWKKPALPFEPRQPLDFE